MTNYDVEKKKKCKRQQNDIIGAAAIRQCISRSLLGDLNDHESILQLAVSQESNPQPSPPPTTSHHHLPPPLPSSRRFAVSHTKLQTSPWVELMRRTIGGKPVICLPRASSVRSGDCAVMCRRSPSSSSSPRRDDGSALNGRVCGCVLAPAR